MERILIFLIVVFIISGTVLANSTSELYWKIEPPVEPFLNWKFKPVLMGTKGDFEIYYTKTCTMILNHKSGQSSISCY